MEHRRLGPSQVEASVVGLGLNNLGRRGTRTEGVEGTNELIHAALDAGVSFFDTADIYGAQFGLSETLLGRALKGLRERVVVATKWGNTNVPQAELDSLGPKGSPAYIRAAVEGSLGRLGVERIDLYQQHTPDPATPIAETLGALEELVQEGKIAAYGHSNFDGGQIRAAADAAQATGATGFVTAQNEYNLLQRSVERDVLPASQAAGIGFLPFFPLANGLRTGAFRRDEIPEGTRLANRPKIVDAAPWDAIEAFRAFAEARAISMLEATFGWFLGNPAVSSVIAGATKPEQLRANAKAGSGWRPNPAEREELEQIFPLSA